MASNQDKKARLRSSDKKKVSRKKAVLEDLDQNIEKPGVDDILLGRNRAFWSRPGNQRFRSFVGKYVKKYIESTDRNEKTKIGHEIYEELSKLGRRFLKFDSSTNMWNQVGKKKAREKIGHTLRDAVGLRARFNLKDENELIFALTSIDPQDHRSGLFSSASSSNSSRSSKSRNILSSSVSTILSTLSRPHRMGESIDQSSLQSIPMKGDDLLKTGLSIRKGTLNSSDSSILRSSSSATTSMQRNVKSDNAKNAMHLIPPNQIDLKLSVTNASKSHHLKDDCSFDNLIDSVFNQDNLNSNEVGELELMSLARTATDDELSAGFTAMSLEASKSATNGSVSMSKSNVSARRSAFSLLRSSFQPSGHDRKGNQTDSINHPRRRSASKPFRNECDESMGIDILGDAGDICSLEVSTLTSYQTKSTRGSGHSWPKHFNAAAEFCQDSSVKSFETEVEFRKVLTNLRENWK
jgi:hypothetical protein